MRRLALCLVLLACAFADDKSIAGRYAGEWKSGSSGNGGGLHFTLEGPETWKCELSFALDGGEVKTVMREVKVQDTKVEFTYDFELQGATLRSHLKGDWNGAGFRGTYATTVVADGSSIDGGTWTGVKEKQ
jgi:hypothetical protein